VLCNANTEREKEREREREREGKQQQQRSREGIHVIRHLSKVILFIALGAAQMPLLQKAERESESGERMGVFV
jgi:hypothetical protein